MSVATIASPAPAAAANTLVAEIPFVLRGDHVMLDASVNGVRGWLLLDTGSSVSSLDAAWAPSAAHVRVLPGRAQVQGSGTFGISLGQADSIAVGPVRMRDVTVALVPLEAVSRSRGTDIRGTLGYDFISRYVVEIDYAARRLRLYDPDGYEYRGPGVEVPVSLALRIPMVQARITPAGGAPVSARLLLDLGSSVLAVRLTAPFVAAHGLLSAAGYEAPIGTGVGGTVVGRITRLGALEIGGLRVAAPTAGLAERAEGFFGSTMADGTVGAPVFRRTTMVLDYARSRVIFEAGPAFAEPYDTDMSGMGLAAAPDQPVSVEYVIAAGPAADAGIAPGDVLLAIDGRRADAGSLDEIRAMFNADGAHRRLTLRRGTTIREVVLTLRRII
ncbi:MAG TPA: aspartyl protease family protein [Longimicrobium sp.]|nr:aspartyl protease family protein [Longimicrobium sp.]